MGDKFEKVGSGSYGVYRKKKSDNSWVFWAIVVGVIIFAVASGS